MEKKRTLRSRLAAVWMCIAVLCTALFAGTMEVQAEDDWAAFKVKVTTGNNVKAGNTVTFKVSITNTTSKKLKLDGIYTWYYRDANNSEKYPGEQFGTLKDSKGKNVVSDYELINPVSFSAKETKTYKLTGTMPKTWNKKAEILVVVNAQSGKTLYAGQGGYSGKNSNTSAQAAIKGTKLTSVKPAKKKATVKWSKQTKGTTGYQIQYSLKKNFKGAKLKTVSSNKKTSVTLKSLKSKKTYYVRIRTYKKASGKTTYSSWSSAKKVKIK